MAQGLACSASSPSNRLGASPSAPIQQQLDLQSPAVPNTPSAPGTLSRLADLPQTGFPALPGTTTPPINLVNQTPLLIPPNGGGTKLPTAGASFEDNFANGIDPSKWGYNYHYSGTCDTNKNTDATQYAAYVIPGCGPETGVFSTGANGLNIAIKPTPGGVASAGKPYVTGQIRSQQAFTPGHYIEMTATLPTTKGVGGAFWMMPQDGSWPPELDLMENLGQDPNTIYQTVHSSGSNQEQVAVNVPGGVQSPHTYGAYWGADTTTFYMDGKVTRTMATPASMNKPMYMILSVNSTPPDHVNWGSPVDGSTQFPASYGVQNVRVLDKAPY